jgi:thioredoxin reductase (NADPH)
MTVVGRGKAAFSVAIIGAGPCGLAAAISLQRAGFRVTIYDRSCVCSSIASYPLYTQFFSTAERLSIGHVPFTTGGDKPTRREALAYYRSIVQHFNLQLRLYEPIVDIRSEDPQFVVTSERRGEGAVEAPYDAVVIATGYFGTPNLLDVPGESLPHVSHLYREGHEAFRRDAVVVGGGNSAVDAALDLHRAGAKVTVVHFADQFDANVKPWILPDMLNRIKDGSIHVRWNARITRIDLESLDIETPAGIERLGAQHVYVMTGFTPSVTLLRRLGVAIDDATGIPQHDRATMETNVPGVFIAGVLASGYDANKIFIENGRNHGDHIAHRLLQLTRA